MVNAVTVESELKVLQWHNIYGGELMRIGIQRAGAALFSVGNRWHRLLSGRWLKGKIIPNLLFRNTLARFEFTLATQ